MLTSNALAVLVSIFSLIVAFGSAIYSFRYTKMNSLSTIQKLLIELVKDCNAVHTKELERIKSLKHSTPNGIFLIEYTPVFSEILKIADILNVTLKNYKQEEQRDFYLTIFWYLLDRDARFHISLDDKSSMIIPRGIHNERQLEKIRKIFPEHIGINGRGLQANPNY